MFSRQHGIAIAAPFINASPDRLDLQVNWSQSPGSRASFSAGLDLETRTVRLVGGGIWNEEDAHLYFEQQLRLVNEARRRFGAVKAFYDVRAWVVEHPDSAFQFQAMNAEIYKPTDRLVSVVGSSAAKQHPRAAIAVGNREVFISMSAAETWLQAYSANADAAQY